MSWIVPHAVTGGSRAHMVEVTTTATTALLGRKNYPGFGSFWPAVVDDEQADLDPAATVRQLRKEQGGDIIVRPSASIIRNLLEAGELHRLSITLCPELVGGGACLFDDGPAGSSWSLTSMTGTESASDLPALRPDPASVMMPVQAGPPA